MAAFLICIAHPLPGWGAPDKLNKGEKPQEAVVSQNLIKADQPTNLSLRKEAQHSIDMGLAWLKNKQNPDGSWSNPDYPAITALVALSFVRDPSASLSYQQYPAFLQNAFKFILSKVQPDGGIYTPSKGLANYNTAICISALTATGNPAFVPVIQKARNYLISLQMDEGEKGVADQTYDGGIGYGGKEKHSDLSNMHLALEALYVSRQLEIDKAKTLGSAKVESKELDYQAALRFIERCQNNPKTNDQSWASGDPDNLGGFIYFPGSSKADEQKLPDGKTALRSYGSMTYAGLLSFIYVNLEKDDPRVQAAYDWIRKHYTVDENPGMGQQGLFYNYHTMAKALAVYGAQEIQVEGRKEKVNWRKELIGKIIGLQKGEGYWVNAEGRWWENDPVLATSYALLSMEIAQAGL
ncbi:MAG: prenyltransferase/squalene oxidase repeat-containing protein [bacterium]